MGDLYGAGEVQEEEVMEYEKQVKALRCCAGANTPGTKCPFYDEYWCGNECLDKRLKDAATSIEELMAQVSDKDYLIQQQADEIERLRRDVKKQQEKMIELAKDRNSWMSVKDPPKESCKVIVRCICNSTGETDVTTAYFRKRYNLFHMTGNRSHWRVTHWMWPWGEPEMEVQE